MQATSKYFKWLAEFLGENGIRVVRVPVQWKYTTLSQNAKEFVDFFNKHKRKENLILGFSYGAVITLMTANILKPKKYISLLSES